MTAHDINSKLVSGLTMESDDQGRLGWSGNLSQWLTATELKQNWDVVKEIQESCEEIKRGNTKFARTFKDIWK